MTAEEIFANSRSGEDKWRDVHSDTGREAGARDAGTCDGGGGVLCPETRHRMAARPADSLCLQPPGRACLLRRGLCFVLFRQSTPTATADTGTVRVFPHCTGSKEKCRCVLQRPRTKRPPRGRGGEAAILKRVQLQGTWAEGLAGNRTEAARWAHDLTVRRSRGLELGGEAWEPPEQGAPRL